MGAISEDYLSTSQPECIDCMDCRAICPEAAISFSGPVTAKTTGIDLTRRGLVYSFGLGVVAAPVLLTESHVKAPDPYLIRPPGALTEDEFLARCTRCGECMRVCIANGLQPSVFEAGFAGLWSPILISKTGYCEYNCTLCGQVCPTGAIKKLTRKEKHETKLGLAQFNRSHCLPWRGESECIVCEEHCPTADKAIKFHKEPTKMADGEVRVLKKPYVADKLCVGCGICENRCPLTDKPAVFVTSRGESRSETGFFL
jgi:ferredoxin